MDSKNDISFPESPTHIERGVLTAIWQSQENLPLMSTLDFLVYYLQNGARTLTTLPMSNAITVFTIAASLFLYGGSLLLFRNVEMMLAESGGALELTVYVKDKTAENTIQTVVQKLRSNPSIRQVSYLSKTQALEIFRKNLGSQGSFLNGLEEDNPLPASIDVILQPDELGVQSSSKIVQSLRSEPIVDEIVYGSEWMERFRDVLKVFRVFGIVILFVILAIVVFLIANTIKLVIYARRDEIAIMQLVGASRSFVRTPFLLGGFIQGLIGSVLGVGLLRISFLFFTAQLKVSPLLGISLPRLIFFGPLGIVTLVLLGAGLGAMGSFFAIGRFMKV